mmetsp:Transcript_85974/g.216396  ORF Transcript_85974/g.216396 Transcript_85974/m.216396 type:complete len:593 (-) Transcript_85974:230-2008(-)
MVRGRANFALAWLLSSASSLAVTGKDLGSGKCGASDSERGRDSVLLSTRVRIEAAPGLASHSDAGSDPEGESLLHGKSVIRELVAGPITAGSMPPSLLEGLSTIRFTPEVRDFAKQTLETLESTFSSIMQASQNDTRMRDAIYAGFGDLTSKFNQDKASATSKTEDADAARKLHMDCRKQESVLFDKHNESAYQLGISLAAEKDALKSAQQKHDAVTLRFQELVDSGLGVLSLEGHSQHLRLVREYQGVIETHNTALQMYYARLWESGNHTKIYNEKKTACDKSQAGFEDSVCEAAESTQTSCDSYTTAYNTRLQDYRVVTDNIAVRATDRKAEWNHLKRVACVLEKLAVLTIDGDLAANSSLSQDIRECYATDFADEDLAIPEKLAPAPQVCLPMPAWPCTEAFAQEEYAKLPTGTTAVPCESVCSAMPTPSPTPSPTPVPTPAPITTPAPAPTPTKGEVRNLGGAEVTSGLAFYPEVWWEGDASGYQPGWYPICGHYFWDNHAGAAIACQKLKGGTGCTGGTLQRHRSTYDIDAVHVGTCDDAQDTELYSCTAGANSWNNFDLYGGQCNAGHGVSIKIQCNAGCTAPADV